MAEGRRPGLVPRRGSEEVRRAYRGSQEDVWLRRMMGQAGRKTKAGMDDET